MAVSLDTKLDQMASVLNADAPPMTTNSFGASKPEAAPIDPNLADPELIIGAQTISDVQPEPVKVGEQYASAKGIFKAVQKGKKVIEDVIGADEAIAASKILKEEKNIVPVEGGYLVKQADDTEVQNILSTIPNYNGKSLNIVRFGDTIGTDAAGFFARIKESNPQLIEDARRGTISMDDLLSAADDVGFGDLVKKFALRQPGDKLPLAEDVVAGIVGMKNLHLEIKTLQETAAKSGTPEDARKVLEAMSLAREFTKGLSGVVSETGRTLGAVGNLAREQNIDLPTLAKETDLVFRRLEATGDIKHLNNFFGMFETDAQRTAFIKGNWWDKLKSGVGKTYDIIQEGFINGLLSSPTTQMMNNFGNTAFGTYTTLENYTAAGIGYIRTLGGLRDAERYTLSRANAFAYGQLEGLKDGLKIAASSFVRGEPVTGSLADKTELGRKIALDATNLGVDKESYLGMGIDLLGTVQRMPGRFMMANDEFYKTVFYRGALRSGAQAEADAAYFAAKKSGKTEEDAKIVSQKVFADFYANPPQSLMDEAMDTAKTLTFQSDMPKYLDTLEKFSSLPVMKFFVPFFRTPANISIEVFNRLPVSPTAWKGIFDDTPAGDLARAKFGLGSAAMGTFGSIAYGMDRPDFFITGGPDKDRSINERDSRLGIQPYSFVFQNKDGSYESISYARMEPVSALLAISADYAKYARQADWNDKNTWQTATELATVGGLAIGNYAGQLSFVQGMSELTAALDTYKQTDDRVVLEKLVEKLSRGTTSAAITAVPGFGSFSAAIERYVSPTGSETYIPSSVGKEANPIVDGFNQALDKAMSRVPGLSSGVAPDLNVWGEPIMQGRGSSLEIINPIRIYKGQFKAVDKELRRLDIGLDMPSRFIMPGIGLNAEQYNRYIELANQMDANRRLPGDSGYDENSTLLPQLNEIIKSDRYLSASPENQANEIQANFKGHYKNAEIRLLQELAVTDDIFKERLKAAQSEGSESTRRKAGRLLIGNE